MLTGDALPIAQEIAREVGLGTKLARASHLKGSADPAILEEASGFAEVYPEDKYLIVKGLQDRHHVVGMTGDGVNDAPALRQAETGIAVRNATDAAKKSASVVLTVDGLSGIVELVKTGRRIYERIVTWILNKIVKTFQVVAFVVLAYLFTGQYVVGVFGMILFLFVTDFVTLALSTDPAPYSSKPDVWDIGGLVRVASALGVLVVAESFVLLYLGSRLFGIGGDATQLHTFVFDYLVFLGVLNVVSLRERGHFWESRPARTLSLFIVGDILFVVLLSLWGVPRLPAIPLVAVLFALGFSAAMTFVPNDFAKVLLFRRAGPNDLVAGTVTNRPEDP